MTPENTPILEGDALAAVRHRGSHLQIIAAAGSGKTEVVSQRVADLIAEGCDPAAIVAFTFTERAAESLKDRIARRVEARLGRAEADRLVGCFVGTIHSYCLRLLQQYVPRYESYDILDEHQLAALLAREATRLGLKRLTGRLYSSIRLFMANVDVVDNELIPDQMLSGAFAEILRRFRGCLDDYRFLTYGRLVSEAVAALAVPTVSIAACGSLRHLIVDEYQDVNPAQEALIRRLAEHHAELCVVGDDDQSIYQFRGADVSNILRFQHRYEDVATFRIETNRRSRPEIIARANSFSSTIEQRLDKAMKNHREPASVEVVTWVAPTAEAEAEQIAESVQALHARGYRYRDIGILIRGYASLETLMNAFSARQIPVQPGSRTGLFRQPEAQLFGQTVAFLADSSWRSKPYEWGEPVTLDSIGLAYAEIFNLSAAGVTSVRQFLEDWRIDAADDSRPANLITRFYALLALCGVPQLDLADPMTIARLGVMARCSNILVDYESVRRRSRPDHASPGEWIGGADRGKWYYRGLAVHVQNWALGAYEGFEGEDDIFLDAVDITTVHKAKGLEWPVVFVPCVSATRFPSSRTGSARTWLVPTDLFDAARYEGSVNDERRLFYVAVTRARDWISVSSHDAIIARTVAHSPFLVDYARGAVGGAGDLCLPESPESRSDDEGRLQLTFSELASFIRCGLAYRLRNRIGFQPPLAPELGFGKAVHHMLRLVAEQVLAAGEIPDGADLDRMFEQNFYLPAANRPAHRQMKAAARRLVDRYVTDHEADLRKVWALERPFELNLDGATLSGRADVILGGGSESAELSIADYKTNSDGPGGHDLQLQVYAASGRLEGLPIIGAHVHDLGSGQKLPVDVSEQAVSAAMGVVDGHIDRLRSRRFEPQPGPICGRCDVRALCRFAASPSVGQAA